jgi:hypothetical protein
MDVVARKWRKLHNAKLNDLYYYYYYYYHYHHHHYWYYYYYSSMEQSRS